MLQLLCSNIKTVQYRYRYFPRKWNFPFVYTTSLLDVLYHSKLPILRVVILILFTQITGTSPSKTQSACYSNDSLYSQLNGST